MNAMRVVAAAALLVTLGACGGGDSDESKQPEPDPLWPPMYQAQLPISYGQPDADDTKFRRLLKPFSLSRYSYQKSAGSPVERIEAPCAFDPAGLLTNDPTKPAKLTFGQPGGADKVFLDPTATDPASVTSRTLKTQQSDTASVSVVAPDVMFNVTVVLSEGPNSSSYFLGVGVLTPEGGFICAGMVNR